MRWLTGAAVGASAVLLLAACGKPARVDGDLTNNWPALPEAKTALPVAGVCYPNEYSPTWYGPFDDVKVDCASGTHKTETVYVASFTGADAQRSTPPLAGSTARAAAYGQCQKAAGDYLGGDWHGGRLWLGLTLPSGNAWSGGARWYRCDVEHFTDSNLQTVATSGSVKDGLRGSRPLAVACLAVTDDGKSGVTGQKDADCAQPHNGEFAGVYTAADHPFPSGKDAAQKVADNGCEGVVARFLGFTNGQVASGHVGWMADSLDEDQWKLGDRSIRCYVVAFNGGSVNGANVVGSMKGLRDGAPKKG
jgi:hypothetical protein